MQKSTLIAGFAALGLLFAGSLTAEAAKAPTEAQKKTLSTCAACHDITSAKKPMMGPPLFGVMGKKPQMDGVPFKKWDKKSMDAFLADPSKVKPDTTMPVNVEDPKERAAVIKALEGLK